MLAKIYSSSTVGVEAMPIEVEVDVSQGMHSFDIVGLADNAIKESRQRIGSAIKNLKLESPLKTNKKVIVNLVPANVKKAGSSYDLPISIGYLVASKQLALDFQTLREKLFIGEVALNGDLKPVSGIINVTEKAEMLGFKEIIIPKDNEYEALMIKKQIKVVALNNLKEVIDYLDGKLQYVEQKFNIQDLLTWNNYSDIDFGDIKGQNVAKRALLISASGGHNLIMVGSPGSGKTLLSKAMANILPPLSITEALELTKLYSVAGYLSKSQPLITNRPFRAPHHTASVASIVGGGAFPKPGEISLAHKGVLFLDEIPEFNRLVLESLRQPLEEGSVTIARVEDILTFPANFILISAMNPCPCGWLNDDQHECSCSAGSIIKYRKKISGPILDRIDLQINVKAVTFDNAFKKRDSQENTILREKVLGARSLQVKRFASHKRKITLNSEMNVNDIENYCPLNPESKAILKESMEKYGLTMRSLHKIIKVSRTIADLDNSDSICKQHINEALGYKSGLENDSFN